MNMNSIDVKKSIKNALQEVGQHMKGQLYLPTYDEMEKKFEEWTTQIEKDDKVGR